MTMPLSEFRLHRRVQFYETDAAGIVHFTNYFRYMEEAEHAMWRAAGLSIHEPQGDLGWPRVSASFDYARPLRFEDEFEVVLRIAAITGRTIRYNCELVRGDTAVAAGTLVIACVRRQPDGHVRSTEIPSEIAARFAVSAPANA
jgi:YbgC/YbaW family acyl-CoA thioester hydrolase